MYQVEINKTEIERRYGDTTTFVENVSFTKPVIINTNITILDEYNDDDDFKIYLKLKKPINFVPLTTVSSKDDNVKTEKTILKTLSFVTSTSPLPLLNQINDYQYDYNEDNVQKEARPREDSVQRSASISLINNTKNVSLYESSHKIYYADFFNLKPAAGKVRFVNKSKSLQNNIWYVPEKYPCWDLPVLYGKLDKKSNASDVFLLYANLLKNVIDNETAESLLSKSYDHSISQAYNKWCTVQPCYADHTLCLFPDKINSKLCDMGYKVEKPTTLQQIAFVNTLNSMRNRIANGVSKEYPNLPSAANMKQIMYDLDLEKIAQAWLHQCLPGPTPCSALDGNYTISLECTKSAENCCKNSIKNHATSKCIPRNECLVSPVIGCIYTWFLSAGTNLKKTDVLCGRTDRLTFNTAQLIWAETNKIGCAYGVRANGDIRVVCNFAPGAPFFLKTKYYCGFIGYKDVSTKFQIKEVDVTDLSYLASLGLYLSPTKHSLNDLKKELTGHTFNYSRILNKSKFKTSNLHRLSKKYDQNIMRKTKIGYQNGTLGVIAKLVTKYTFYEESESRCDREEPIYVAGNPGSLCIERSRRFHALCYDFRDPTPGYRLVAVVAPIALFSLILYDLFSSVVRQTNY
ncbi:uncharacterized protein ACR2FA_002006 [Aphomia sociella]